VGKVWAGSLGVLALLLARSPRRPAIRVLCLIGVFLPLSCGSVRMIAWWLLIVAPILAACVISLPWLEGINPVMLQPGRSHRVESDLEAAAKYLRDRADQDRIFTRFAWGEYLGFRLAPKKFQVFMDGRIEIFPDSVWAEYAAITRGRADWEEILEQYGVDFLVLDQSEYHTELLPQVRRSPHWKQVFEQGPVVVFERTRMQEKK
jgi:hypothetical protein